MIYWYASVGTLKRQRLIRGRNGGIEVLVQETFFAQRFTGEGEVGGRKWEG